MECRWCGERFAAPEPWAVHELEHQLLQDRRFWDLVRASAGGPAG